MARTWGRSEALLTTEGRSWPWPVGGWQGRLWAQQKWKVYVCTIAALHSSLGWVREQDMGQRAAPSPRPCGVPVQCATGAEQNISSYLCVIVEH